MQISASETEASPSPALAGRSLTLDLRSPLMDHTPRMDPTHFGMSRDLTPRGLELTPRTPSLSRTPRQSSTASLNGNTLVTSPGSACDCPGCPGNTNLLHTDSLIDDTNSNTITLSGGESCEDYLDTLDRKVNEIMNRDSRRSSSHDLVTGRKKTMADLSNNGNPCSRSPVSGPHHRRERQRPPDGAIRFEEDGKESSTETIDSDQEDVTQAWSDEDSDHYVLRRRSIARRPIRLKNRNSILSLQSVSTLSSEEGEASEYPSSQRSTLESNPEILREMAEMSRAVAVEKTASLMASLKIHHGSDDDSGEEDDRDPVLVTARAVSDSGVYSGFGNTEE